MFENAPSPVMIGIVATSPPCGINAALWVANRRKSTPPDLVGNTKKLDAVVDRKFPDDLNSSSIFSKVIVHKLSESSRSDLYSLCRMSCTADVIQNQSPKFIDLGFLNINALDESTGLSIPVTRIQRPMDGFHWSVRDYVFGEATAVGMSF